MAAGKTDGARVGRRSDLGREGRQKGDCRDVEAKERKTWNRISWVG